MILRGKMMKKTICFLLFLLLALNSSCSNFGASTKETEQVPTNISGTATSISFLLPTIVPSRFDSPSPTLTTEEKENYIKLALKDNAGCDLPCWWGIEPGKTSWDNVEIMLLHLGVTQGDSKFNFGYGTSWLNIESIQTYGSITFSTKQGIVESIAISVGGDNLPELQRAWEYYSADKILLKYGKPSRIMVDVSTYGNTEYVGYGYWLYYDDAGFLIVTGGKTKKQENLRICPSFDYSENIHEIHIYLQSPNSTLPLETIVGQSNIELIQPYLKSLENATGKSEDEYYAEYLKNQYGTCFTTPLKIWQ